MGLPEHLLKQLSDLKAKAQNEIESLLIKYAEDNIKYKEGDFVKPLGNVQTQELAEVVSTNISVVGDNKVVVTYRCTADGKEHILTDDQLIYAGMPEKEDYATRRLTDITGFGSTKFYVLQAYGAGLYKYRHDDTCLAPVSLRHVQELKRTGFSKITILAFYLGTVSVKPNIDIDLIIPAE